MCAELIYRPAESRSRMFSKLGRTSVAARSSLSWESLRLVFEPPTSLVVFLRIARIDGSISTDSFLYTTVLLIYCGVLAFILDLYLACIRLVARLPLKSSLLRVVTLRAPSLCLIFVDWTLPWR